MIISKDYRQLESKYYMQVVRRMLPVIAKGKGCKVWDVDGNEYLDFTAGWAVLNVGHSHPSLNDAIANQASQLAQMTNLFYTIPQLELAKILVDNSCIDRIFFCNSGAEANEGAVKLARKWGRKNLNGAFEVITAVNSFHGRTLGMMSATGQKHYQDAWQPLPQGFVNVEYNNVKSIKEATTDNTCAVLLEPLQGEGGVNIPDNDYLYQVQEWCRSLGILFMLDEVQTGMGRLGTLFGYQRFEGVQPDVITLGKALGGGLPLGAFGSTEQCSVLEPGDHGSTFGGNAVTTAAGAASARVILENNLPQKALKAEKYLFEKINNLRKRHPVITGVRGMGLLIGIELDENIAAELVQISLKKGLLINAVRPNVIRLMPPLNIENSHIDMCIDIIDKAISEIHANV